MIETYTKEKYKNLILTKDTNNIELAINLAKGQSELDELVDMFVNEIMLPVEFLVFNFGENKSLVKRTHTNLKLSRKVEMYYFVNLPSFKVRPFANHFYTKYVRGVKGELNYGSLFISERKEETYRGVEWCVLVTETELHCQKPLEGKEFKKFINRCVEILDK